METAPQLGNFCQHLELYQNFLNFKKSTRGITPKTEDWFKCTVLVFLKAQPDSVDVTRLTTNDIAAFLGRYNAKPHSKHSFYRAIKLFYKWISTTYQVQSPFIDRFGNAVIQPPKLPEKALPTMDPDTAELLVFNAGNVRNAAIISLLLSSGVRRSELANIKLADVDLDSRRIKVIGKGGKLGWLVYSEFTERMLKEYLAQQDLKPEDSLFGLNTYGVQSMLKRLSAKTGIQCNAHTFRRGFATELRKKGVNELDISELGRWSKVDMVKRYTKAYTFEDAAKRYQDVF